MRAAVTREYGPPEVLEIRDVARPVPGSRDLLIRVHTSVVTPSDCYIRSGIPQARLVMRLMVRTMFGVTRPRRVQGVVLAGEVVQTGKGVTRFTVGDRVCAFTGTRVGGWAEYATVPETKIVARVPASLDYDHAAALPYGALLGLYFIRKANIQPGDAVLIYGASGAIGTSAVQLAKNLGARVTGVCGPTNVELVSSLGAEEVLDYTTQQTAGDRKYDVVIDAAGRRKTSALKDACRAALTERGRYISIDDELPKVRPEDLAYIMSLVEAGTFHPVIDRTFPLGEIVEAHRYVELGHKRGNVVITI